jgi:esterase/lipase
MWWILLLVFLLLAFLGLGPKPVLPPFVGKILAVKKLDQLNLWLAEQEKKLLPIEEGCERRVQWFDAIEKSEYSIVYLHGLSASSKEIQPLPEQLAQQLSANIYFIRLSGHGHSSESNGAEMGVTSATQWQQDVYQALQIGQLIGDKVIVLATSTGATLANSVLSLPNIAPSIHALLYMSPNFGVADKLSPLLIWPWARFIIPKLHGKHHHWLPMNSQYSKGWTWRYPVEALVQMQLLIQLARKVPVSVKNIPLFITYCPDDTVVRVDRIVSMYQQWLGKKSLHARYIREGSKHLLAGDLHHPENTGLIVRQMFEFLQNLPNK